MDRSEILEIKKLFSKYVEGESAAKTITGCMITSDKQIKSAFCRKLLSEDRDAILKYFSVFKKIYPTSNCDVRSGDMDDNNSMGYLLDKLNGTDLNNKDLNNILFEKVAGTLPESPYVVLLLQYAYDVPIKDKNKEKQKSDSEGNVYGNESDETYTFIACAVCPLKVGDKHLGVDAKEEIGLCKADKTIESPVFGFMYPSFNGRAADTGNIMCYQTDKLTIAGPLFGENVQVKESKPTVKAKKNAPVATSKTPEEPDTSADKTEGYDYEAEEPLFSKDDDFPKSKIYEDHADNSTKVLADKKPSEKKISIYGGKNRITKQFIDGMEYYLIPVNDAVLN